MSFLCKVEKGAAWPGAGAPAIDGSKPGRTKKKKTYIKARKLARKARGSQIGRKKGVTTVRNPKSNVKLGKNARKAAKFQSSEAKATDKTKRTVPSKEGQLGEEDSPRANIMLEKKRGGRR